MVNCFSQNGIILAAYFTNHQMNRVLKALFCATLSLGLMSASCSRQMEPVPQKLCEGIMCTAMFAMITAQVTDQNGQAVVLDEYYTLRVKTGEKITPQQQLTGDTYVILDDSYQKSLANQSEDFRFVGKKNGATIVNETYRLSADCCHVKKESGNATVIVK